MNKNVIRSTSLCPRCHTTSFKGATQHALSFLSVFKTCVCSTKKGSIKEKGLSRGETTDRQHREWKFSVPLKLQNIV